MTDPCVVVDTLAAFQLDTLRRINRKFAALRNLAQLLEQLGDLSALVPNIGQLIPVVNIDLALYEQLVASCPYLNLPPVTTGDVNQLQSYVTSAYANFFNRLLRHPWNRMGQLQQELDSYQSQITGAFAQAGDFLRCLQTVCATGRAVAGQLEAVRDADIAKEIKTFTENYVANSGRVLSAGAQEKYAQIAAGKQQLIALGADVKLDYTQAKAALSAPGS